MRDSVSSIVCGICVTHITCTRNYRKYRSYLLNAKHWASEILLFEKSKQNHKAFSSSAHIVQLNDFISSFFVSEWWRGRQSILFNKTYLNNVFCQKNELYASCIQPVYRSTFRWRLLRETLARIAHIHSHAMQGVLTLWYIKNNWAIPQWQNFI